MDGWRWVAGGCLLLGRAPASSLTVSASRESRDTRVRNASKSKREQANISLFSNPPFFSNRRAKRQSAITTDGYHEHVNANRPPGGRDSRIRTNF
ncbi:uncharacterized protein J3D65DRAFT_628821 [Phyllosticta citribraziliensis]|uniref:Secreted protein n=1 Tax=Phyllosticta citribraziliensis TaxID=989973 RepID=A0ABR1LHL9_9PEZI